MNGQTIILRALFPGTCDAATLANLAFPLLLKAALHHALEANGERGSMVVVTGQAHSVVVVRCADHRAGLRAVESVLNQLDMRQFWQVRWLDRAEDVWRGVRCSDELFMDGIACLKESAP